MYSCMFLVKVFRLCPRDPGSSNKLTGGGAGGAPGCRHGLSGGWADGFAAAKPAWTGARNHAKSYGKIIQKTMENLVKGGTGHTP